MESHLQPNNATSAIMDIPIDSPIVTAQTLGSVLAAVLDLLLFQRKQIPLVYPTFKFMVEKFQPLLNGAADGDEELAWDDYLMERARVGALKTLVNIKSLKRDVAQQIEELDVDRVTFLFGSNVLIANEAFEIVLPPMDRNHFGENHRDEKTAVVRQVSMRILSALNTFEPPRNAHSNSTTNVYALLHLRRANENFPAGQHVVHDDFEPHPDCRWTTFRLHNTARPDDGNCCRDLHVFRDLAALQVNGGSQSSAEAQLREDGAQIEEDIIDAEPNRTWYESEIVVTGFKDVPIKGKPIWV